MYCGKPVQENADFCMYCGKPLPKLQPAPVQQQTPLTGPETAPSRQIPAAETITQDQPVPISPNEGREICLGDLEFTESAAAALKGPLGGIIGAVGSYLGGILDIFRKKGTLIGTVLLAVMWGVLWYLRDSDSQIVKILSFLTFSEGGLDRDIPGMIGGALGKGTVAAAIVSLFSGGLKGLFKGIGALFTGHGEKRSIVGIVIGILAGAASYLFFCGTGASLSSAIAGIAGAVLSLEAMGSGQGKLFDLISSVTSRKTEGIRSAVRGRCDSLLTGLTLGFALAAALSSLGVLEVIS